MLPRDRAEKIITLSQAGWPVKDIAGQLGHAPQTIRDYLSGDRTPGFEPRDQACSPTLWSTTAADAGLDTNNGTASGVSELARTDLPLFSAPSRAGPGGGEFVTVRSLCAGYWQVGLTLRRMPVEFLADEAAACGRYAEVPPRGGQG
jgi:hypothetical protein